MPLRSPRKYQSTTDLKAAAASAYRPLTPPSPLPEIKSSRRKNEDVFVGVRIRPEYNGTCAWSYNTQSIYQANVPNDHYSFDAVFLPEDDNATIYDIGVRRVVQGVCDGYNGTVFAYGQTGSGKTHTLQGNANTQGITTMAARDILGLIQTYPKEYSVRLSYLEIYNERIIDLLSNSSQSSAAEEIKLREDKKFGMVAYPIISTPITSLPQFNQVVEKASTNRQSARTDFNEHSSRSHAIVQFFVEWRGRCSVLNMIDLAGSEKASKDVDRRKEGAYINKSLLTLGTVIARLTSGNTGFIPYRDSKLTRLLQPTLSGQSLVCVLGMINASPHQVNETINTLKFASRTKLIENKVQKADNDDSDKECNRCFALQKQVDELEALTKRLLEEASAAQQARRISDLDFSVSPRLSTCSGNSSNDFGRMQRKVEDLIKSKDLEIRYLRNTVSDKDQIINALRLAAHKLEVSELKQVERLVGAVVKISENNAARSPKPSANEQDSSRFNVSIHRQGAVF